MCKQAQTASFNTAHLVCRNPCVRKAMERSSNTVFQVQNGNISSTHIENSIGTSSGQRMKKLVMLLETNTSKMNLCVN